MNRLCVMGNMVLPTPHSTGTWTGGGRGDGSKGREGDSTATSHHEKAHQQQQKMARWKEVDCRGREGEAGSAACKERKATGRQASREDAYCRTLQAPTVQRVALISTTHACCHAPTVTILPSPSSPSPPPFAAPPYLLAVVHHVLPDHAPPLLVPAQVEVDVVAPQHALLPHLRKLHALDGLRALRHEDDQVPALPRVGARLVCPGDGDAAVQERHLATLVQPAAKPVGNEGPKVVVLQRRVEEDGGLATGHRHCRRGGRGGWEGR